MHLDSICVSCQHRFNGVICESKNFQTSTVITKHYNTRKKDTKNKL